MKEETINIAGVNCKVSLLSTLSYESIYNSSIGTDYLKRDSDRLNLIDKEIRDNGFKPTTTTSKPIKASESVGNRGDDVKGANKPRKRNSRLSKNSVEKR